MQFSGSGVGRNRCRYVGCIQRSPGLSRLQPLLAALSRATCEQAAKRTRTKGGRDGADSAGRTRVWLQFHDGCGQEPAVVHRRLDKYGNAAAVTREPNLRLADREACRGAQPTVARLTALTQAQTGAHSTRGWG